MKQEQKAGELKIGSNNFEDLSGLSSGFFEIHCSSVQRCLGLAVLFV